jgi:hypothetical protein
MALNGAMSLHCKLDLPTDIARRCRDRDADHQRPQAELKPAAFAFWRVGFHRRIIRRRGRREQAKLGRLAPRGRTRAAAQTASSRRFGLRVATITCGSCVSLTLQSHPHSGRGSFISNSSTHLTVLGFMNSKRQRPSWTSLLAATRWAASIASSRVIAALSPIADRWSKGFRATRSPVTGRERRDNRGITIDPSPRVETARRYDRIPCSVDDPARP